MSVEHYENFPVASWLCPPELRPAIRAIYHFARTADDLADEGDAAPAQRLADLAAYRADFAAIVAGCAPSPRWRGVFDALRCALAEYALPTDLLADLLSAFEQDVTQHHYIDRAELLDYCRRSANPIGRLLLHLYHVNDNDSLRRSDAICTALQLANFWQDLSVDRPRGRLYVPYADCTSHEVNARALMESNEVAGAAGLVCSEVRWARALMLDGAPLVHRVPGRAGCELRLVVQGGLRILDKVERLGADALHIRPRLLPTDAPALLWRAWRMRPTTRPMAQGMA